MGTPLHRSRLKGSLCLGCGSPDHWIKGCPSFNVHNAQVSTAGIELGNVVAECWIVSAEPEEEKIVRLPALSPEDASSSDFAQLQDLALEYIGCSDKMNRNPLILLNYHNFQNAVQQAGLFYSVISLKAALRDAILRTHMVPSTAATMLSTSAAMAAKTARNLDRYTKEFGDTRRPGYE